MPTPCEIPGARLPAATAAAVPMARSVAEDLEAIFPHRSRTQGAPALRLRVGAGRAGGTAHARPVGYASAVGALAAAALAGVSAGALLGPGPVALRPQPGLQVKAPALPSPGPLPAGPLHARPPRILAAAPQSPASARATLHKASARRPAAQRRHAVMARRARCHGASCRAPSVMQADARLRHAYAEARRAGVSSTVLADYRDRWDSLRRRAPREPSLVAARYGAMADDLDRMAARHAVERERAPRHVGPWRALRTQIAALWR